MCNTDLFLASQSLPCFNAGALALFPTGLSRVAGPDQWTHLPVQRAIPSKLQPQSGDSWTTDSKKSWLQNLIETGDYCGMLWVEGWISPNWFGYGWRKSPGFIFKWPKSRMWCFVTCWIFTSTTVVRTGRILRPAWHRKATSLDRQLEFRYQKCQVVGFRDVGTNGFSFYLRGHFFWLPAFSMLVIFGNLWGRPWYSMVQCSAWMHWRQPWRLVKPKIAVLQVLSHSQIRVITHSLHIT